MSDEDRSHSFAFLAEHLEAEVNEMGVLCPATAASAERSAAAQVPAHLVSAHLMPGSIDASLAVELGGPPLVRRLVLLAPVTAH